MKTKLLKIVRKRYSITHYPNGTYFYGKFEHSSITILRDKYNSDRYFLSRADKNDAYFKCLKNLLLWILVDYRNSGKRRNLKEKNKSVGEKLWYNG